MKSKLGQYSLSKTYYDKYGFKMSSSSSSANGGSGGHSSDDDSIALLKKRNFRDFQKQCTVSSGSGVESVDLCDEMKLFKVLEHERMKKAKFSHSGLLGSGLSGSAMD